MKGSIDRLYRALSLIADDDLDSALWFTARQHLQNGNMNFAYELAKKSTHVDAVWLCSILADIVTPLTYHDVKLRFLNCYPHEENDKRFQLLSTLINRVAIPRTDVLYFYDSVDSALKVEPIAMLWGYYTTRDRSLLLRAAKLGDSAAIHEFLNFGFNESVEYVRYLAYCTIHLSGNLHHWLFSIENVKDDAVVYEIGKWMHNFSEISGWGVKFLPRYYRSNECTREAVNQWLLIARRIGGMQLPREIRKMVGKMIWSTRIEGLYK